MNNKKQSSVDYLISQLQRSKDWHRVLNEVSQMSSAKVDIIAEAKAMHQKEVIEAFDEGQEYEYQYHINSTPKFYSDAYYNETFGGKTNKMNTRFRKKPVEIEALKFTRENWQDVLIFTQGQAHTLTIERRIDGKCTCIIATLEGQHIANEGDWIIKGVQGEYYPCKPDIFEMTYDRVGGQDNE